MSSDLLPTLRAIVRDEIARLRPPALGVVTQVYPRADDGNDGNHQVNVRLCGSSVELQRVPVTVPRAGWSILPNLDDLLLVTFVGGDLNAPVAIGTLYSDRDHPPVAQEHELVYVAPPPDSDDDAVRRMHFELANGSTFTIKDGSLEIVMGGTTVTVQGDGDVSIKAAGNISLDADGDISMSAGGKVSVSAGSDLALKAGANATLEGSAATKVKGAQVTLAGVTQFSPS